MSKNTGKIAPHLFDQFIHTKCGYPRAEVKTGPQFGVDVSVVDLPGNMALAMTSDPLSLIPTLGLQESAWLSVHLMANDMATTGHRPMYGQFVLNLPSPFSQEDFKTYWDYIHRFCSEIQTSITGGHTGFVEGQNSTIAGGGTMIAVAPRDTILVSTAAQAGDTILVTKSAAISSAAILAMSFPETVRNKAGHEIFQAACDSFYHTSSLQDALIAVSNRSTAPSVTAMHDVTEGGVLGAIYELALASGNGALIDTDKLPIGEVQATVCNIFGLDPRFCIGAGAMVIACKKESASDIIDRLTRANIPCSEVGELFEKQYGIQLLEDGKKVELTYSETDPYWAAFYNAIKSGWR